MQLPTRNLSRTGLLILATFLLFQVSRAQFLASTKAREQSRPEVPVTTTAPAGAPIVLWDESGISTGFRTNSQNYEPGHDAFDDELADDFFVPADQTWTIQEVNVQGAYLAGSTGTASSVNVTFCLNDATFPGAPIPGGTYQNISFVDAAGNFAIILPSSLVLTPGTYWVSVQANMISTDGQWAWDDNLFQRGVGAVWRNPGGGLMTSCTANWGRRLNCINNPSGPDQRFQILGTSVGGTPTPTPSPSGTPTATATPIGTDKILFNTTRDDNFEIYVMDTNGAQQTNLTNNLADDVNPVWSPDGSKIAFASARDSKELDIYVMNADGSNPVRLTNDPAEDSSPTWSPDGSKIAFVSFRDSNYEIYVMDSTGANQIRLTNDPAEDVAPAWSPDGSKIAFVSTRDGNYEIYVMGANGSNPANLTNNLADDFAPAWSPDGTQIAFESFRDNNFEIYRMAANGSNPTRLTNSPTDDVYATWSPDGTKIAFTTNRDGNYEIYVMGADGSSPTNLTNNPAPDIDADWQRPPPPTPTPTPSITPSATSTATATATATTTATASVTPPSPTPTPTGTVTATATPTATPTSTVSTPSPSPTPSPARAVNISTRLRVQTGNNVLIGGFIVTGTEPKQVVVRAIGPSLGTQGVPDPLADPILELRAANGDLIMQNDNWEDIPSQASQLTALGLGLTNQLESGLITTLAPNGAYTAIVAGNNGGTGIGLVEIYDVGPAAASELANISTRGFVLTGNDVMIGGFILGSSSGSSHVAVRGIGPSLAGSVNPVLADPILELHDSNGATIAANDNWQDDPISAEQLSAYGLAPTDPNESGIFQSLPPGPFTAILAGQDGGTGIGLVEVYNVH